MAGRAAARPAQARGGAARSRIRMLTGSQRIDRSQGPARAPVRAGAGGPDSRALALPGRIAVVVVAAVSVAVGLSSGVGFLESAPYGVVGALLAIRRPRNSVGWLLLAGAWAFAVSSINVPATAAQLMTGAVPPAVMAIAVVQAASGGPLIILLFVITLVFPTGRLPTGGWGRLARFALALLSGRSPHSPDGCGTHRAFGFGADCVFERQQDV
jgi:hypothetical protein